MAVSMIVLVFEVADHHPGFEQSVPVVAVEALLPEAVVERFDVPVVPRRSGRNVGQSDLTFAKLLQRLGNQFRTVVHPQHLRWPASRREHAFQFDDEPFGGDRPLDNVQQRAPGMFVDHGRDLDRLAVHGAPSAARRARDDTPARSRGEITFTCSPSSRHTPKPVGSRPRCHIAVLRPAVLRIFPVNVTGLLSQIRVIFSDGRANPLPQFMRPWNRRMAPDRFTSPLASPRVTTRRTQTPGQCWRATGFTLPPPRAAHLVPLPSDRDTLAQ